MSTSSLSSSALQASQPRKVSDRLAALAANLRAGYAQKVGVVVYNTVGLRDALMQELEMRLAGEVKIRRLEMMPQRLSLYDRLEMRDNAEPAAYFAFGFETLTDDMRRALLGSTCARVDTILRMRVPLLVWLGAPDLQDLVRRTPEYFDTGFERDDFRSAATGAKRIKELDRAMVQLLANHAPVLVPREEMCKRALLFRNLRIRLQAQAQPLVGADCARAAGFGQPLHPPGRSGGGAGVLSGGTRYARGPGRQSRHGRWWGRAMPAKKRAIGKPP